MINVQEIPAGILVACAAFLAGAFVAVWMFLMQTRAQKQSVLAPTSR